MKGTVVALGRLQGRPAAARLVDGALDDLLICPAPGGAPPPETLLRGRIGRPMKGLGGVFVDLPEGRSGFLRQTRGLRPGASLLVQVSGHAEGGKAVPLTDRLLFKGRHAILTPGVPGLNISRQIRDPQTRARLESAAARAMEGAAADLGLILRTAAEWADDEDLAAQIAALRTLAKRILSEAEGPPASLLEAPDPHALALRDWALPAPDIWADGPTAFADHAVTERVDELLSPVVALGGGASMAIEPTRALVAVDVDTGADTSPAAGLKANLAVARALPRQLRLRGLGGQVTVDFAPMPKPDRQRLDQSLQAAVRRDDGSVTLAGWTPLGHFELQRKRDRPPLAQVLRP